uniref:Uncharacterized protein n=1 Tax=Romanomermis culicivorax TaxID=13658 RepID=A0A915I5B0_ROMCU
MLIKAAAALPKFLSIVATRLGPSPVISIASSNQSTNTFLLKGFLGGVVAVPPLANVWVGVTIPTRAQQKWSGLGPVDWLGSAPVDWLQHQSYGCNICIGWGKVASGQP